MAVCLADNFEGVELILRIVLGREDITVKAGKMSLEDIADYTELSLDTIKELATQSMQLA